MSQLTKDDQLVAEVRASQSSAQVIATTLATDERVIARLTDGIYRQPSSALRELISNAYDADATQVTINTDAPRFGRIVVEDNGHGMTPEALVNVIQHIGGSAKRHTKGQSLEVTSQHDSTLSPNGRKLIGKIGIGLFSVSQLTQTFQVITKVKNDSFRTIATIALRQYSDAQSESNQFESGKVRIWREPASDKSSHGTTIILDTLRPEARRILKSEAWWAGITNNKALSADEVKQDIDPPTFHIGEVRKNGDEIERAQCVPWDAADSPEVAFEKLVNSIWAHSHGTTLPKLEKMLDNYLQMIWHLSLAIPAPYVQSHLFDLQPQNWADSFLLSNKPKGTAERVNLTTVQTLREKLELEDSSIDPNEFRVVIDDLSLMRPIKFEGLPTTRHQLKRQIIFAGKCREEFSGIAPELSGGPLQFEAYLFWSPKIVPTEHQGSLIRIHGSSGTLFDPSFMRYQISEQTRLKQTVCEVFVHVGLDSALNIDRESFNNAHPHSIFLARWLHNALRQLASTQKRLAGEIRKVNRSEFQLKNLNDLDALVSKIWDEVAGETGDEVPSIEFVTDTQASDLQRSGYTFSRNAVFGATAGKRYSKSPFVERKLKAIAQILSAYGLLENLNKKRQEHLLSAIHDVLETAEE